MSREKQIDEMSGVVGQAINHNCWLSDERMEEIDMKGVAEELYDAGYRKKSEGEWKQTKEPLGVYDVDCVECSVCGESWVLDEDFDYDVVKDFWNFCPNCGAKMKGGEQ